MYVRTFLYIICMCMYYVGVSPDSPNDFVEPPILPSITPSLPIKEGMVEKRGHSAKYLMFSKCVC